MIKSSNKRIAINTLVIYVRLLIVTCVSLLTTRFVLKALGASDYGLYNVVSSILIMLNCISTGMHTTTRRYINVEMGRKGGDMNKIFNICLMLHFGFALFIFIVCEGIGIWYINNHLNINPEKMADAHFVFQIAVLVSCLGILNVPYQGLIEAFEKFWQLAAVDVFNAIFKLIAVIILVYYSGNALRFYSVMMGIITLSSFTLYRVICRYQWYNVIRFKIYHDKSLYKQILYFNNYVSMGAFGALAKNQGIAVMINFFFGTVVNAAYAIGAQIQSFVELLIGNLATASGPQITQNLSAGNLEQSVDICARINRYVMLLMTLVFFPLVTGIDYILKLWLDVPPEGAALFTKWILLCGFIGSMTASLSNFIMAYGKIRWFTIASTVIDVVFLICGLGFLSLGYPAVTIVVLLAVNKILNVIIVYVLMHYIIKFDSLGFILKANFRPAIIIFIAVTIYIFLPYLYLHPLMQITLMSIFVLVGILLIGLMPQERDYIYGFIVNKFNIRNKSKQWKIL